MADKVQEQLVEELQRVTAKIGWWALNRKALQRVVTGLEALDMAVIADKPHMTVSGTGDKAKLVAIFKLLRACGYTPSSRPEPGDSWLACLWHKDGSDVALWLSFTSSVCKRVKVGTKMEEVPVYETRCEDITVTEEDEGNG